MTRKQWRLDRIRAIEREYEVALAAAEELVERFNANPSLLDDQRLRFRDYRNFRDNLEPTYLVRMFAEFEAGLREAWKSAFRRRSSPTTRHLVDSLAAYCFVAEDWRDRVHEVRTSRNALVHEGDDDAPLVGVRVARGHLCRFFSQLPHEW